jgi:hypothetical protein
MDDALRGLNRYRGRTEGAHDTRLLILLRYRGDGAWSIQHDTGELWLLSKTSGSRGREADELSSWRATRTRDRNEIVTDRLSSQILLGRTTIGT